VIGKLERSFDQDELSRIIDPGFVQRAARLLSEYTTVLRGFTPPSEITVCDTISLTKALVTGLSVPSCSDEDLLMSSDDDEMFSRILLTRIGTRPLLEDIIVEVNADDTAFFGLVDRDRFTDLLTYILEDLVGTMTSRISIGLGKCGKDIVITLSGDRSADGTSHQCRTTRFLQGLSERAGGRLAIHEDPAMLRFEITVSAAS